MRMILALLVMAGCGDDSAPVDSGADDASLLDAPGSDVAGDAPGLDAGEALHPQIAAFIRSDVASSLTIEVDSFPGAEPSSSVTDSFGDVLRAVLNKPGGITFVEDGSLPSRGDTPWTFGELQSLATNNESLTIDADATRLHLLFVDGRFMVDNVIGIVVGTHAIVIFREVLDGVCSGAVLNPLMREELCDVAEVTVLTHEMGHALGLVNAGLPMVSDHEDPERAKHDVDPECVMYFAFQGPGVGDLLGDFVGGTAEPVGYCAPSLADIAAARD